MYVLMYIHMYIHTHTHTHTVQFATFVEGSSQVPTLVTDGLTVSVSVTSTVVTHSWSSRVA